MLYLFFLNKKELNLGFIQVFKYGVGSGQMVRFRSTVVTVHSEQCITVSYGLTQLEDDELEDPPVVQHAHKEGEEEDQGQNLNNKYTIHIY